MPRTALALALLLATAAPAVAQTQLELNFKAKADAMAADAKLNKAYGALAKKLDAAARKQLLKAEQRWITFRDAEITFEEARNEGGSMQQMVHWNVYRHLTEKRTEELELATAGQPDPKADAALNAQYKDLQKELPATERPLLVKAEVAWIAFRDAELAYEALRFPGQRDGALARMTTERQLRLLYLDNNLGGLP